MKLNRRQRRAKIRPDANQSPGDQMKAFLKSPGKFHIVQLPDDKSFVVKVTDAEMPIFLTICQQLRGVLGHCEAIPATPVDASVATAQQIAESSAESTLKIRQARARQEAAEDPVQRAEAELVAARQRAAAEGISPDVVADTNAALNRNLFDQKRGARRGPKHAKPEPDSVFDQLAAGADSDNDETKKQIAAMQIAAAQAQVDKANEQLEKANDALAAAMDRGGELHNQSVIDRFTAKAGDAIADKLDTDEPGTTGHVSEDVCDDNECQLHATYRNHVRPPTEHIDLTDQLHRLQTELADALRRGQTARAGAIRGDIFALRTRLGQNAI